MIEPMAIMLVGIGGTGKSSIAMELHSLLEAGGYRSQLIRFDEFRKQLAPPGTDPFSSDPEIKRVIYDLATTEFLKYLQGGASLVIDSGLSVERIRRQIKQAIKALKIVHIFCPLLIAIFRDTKRSFLGRAHERGKYLHLRALASLLNPFNKTKFPQPGITYPFEYPLCADIHINTFFKNPRTAAEEILAAFKL